MDSDDKVRVRIVTAQRVRYDQTVTMTRAEWEELKKTDETEMESDGGPLPGWLDLTNILDADEFDEPQLFLVDDKGKAVKPDDEYTGGE